MSRWTFKRWLLWIVILAALLAGLMGVSVSLGAVTIPLSKSWAILGHQFLGLSAGGKWTASDSSIILDLRLPRILSGALVGSALAMAGSVLQALLRNPLADPFVLGISSGAAVGAVLAILFGLGATFLGAYAVPGSALLNDGVEVLDGLNPLDGTDGDNDLGQDGLTSREEVELGADPLEADTDGDRLLDGEEVTAQTDPLSADSDGDGFTDEAELSEGADPLLRISIPPVKRWVGGAASGPTNWANANNWEPASVPTAADNVLIPVTAQQPTLTAAATAKRVVVEDGATLSLGNYTLNVVGDVSALGTFRKELAAYGTSKGTVRFPLGTRVPYGLITRIVRFRVRENRARADAKRKRK